MDKQQLDQLSVGLPLLRFSLAEDSTFAQSALAQAYLDFYGINFQREMDGLTHGFGRIDSDEFKIAAIVQENMFCIFIYNDICYIKSSDLKYGALDLVQGCNFSLYSMRASIL